MKFARVPVEHAVGGILAHSEHWSRTVLRKGRILTTADIEGLAGAGIRLVTIARLEAGDVGEDEAASRIAAACAGANVRVGAAFTGRANLYAERAGVARIDEARVAALNSIDEAITLATAAQATRMVPRQMLATIKIIPFAAAQTFVETAERLATRSPLISVSPFKSHRAALILTFLAGTRPQILDKSAGAVAARLASLESELAMERRVPHDEAAIAEAIDESLQSGTDPILILGASAITDRRDVIPAAILRAGGEIVRFGMPVDPGNLLLLARIGATNVIGLPGCARSPKRNGFDFVLERVLTGETVTSNDIAAMAVGGLLAEIGSRPQPRESAPEQSARAPEIAAVVLAAGLSTRMGRNKLILPVGGKPLVRHVVESAVASHISRTIVVVGNAAESVRAALANLPVTFAENPDYGFGLSTSLKCGIRAVPAECDGAVVLLGDMPAVTSSLLDRMTAAFDPVEGRAICVATHRDKRGNPVLWSRRFFPEILTLEGDAGAKRLIAENEDVVWEIEAGDEVLIDIDTPDALAAYAARSP